jgi:hypothetical protein
VIGRNRVQLGELMGKKVFDAAVGLREIGAVVVCTRDHRSDKQR